MLLLCSGITGELLDAFGDETESLSTIISLLPILFVVRTVARVFSTPRGNLLDVLHFFGI